MIQEEVHQDQELTRIIEELKRDSKLNDHYTLENDKLHYKGRLVLAANSVWIPKLLHEFHLTPMGGHFGVYITYLRIAQTLHWKGMKKGL